ncbi:hypothetical protein BOX15_Mlig008096g2 [Macrostomum lignano]|uniref:Uncharacterized protein n=1 Tax=Macrostomum lignano TaxID=282301 RepID=A0A267E977_9PLAT|nr:hypothetical protein BOX15_Mlig008096g2 [Macrostomum lignano]
MDPSQREAEAAAAELDNPTLMINQPRLKVRRNAICVIDVRQEVPTFDGIQRFPIGCAGKPDEAAIGLSEILD